MLGFGLEAGNRKFVPKLGHALFLGAAILFGCGGGGGGGGSSSTGLTGGSTNGATTGLTTGTTTASTTGATTGTTTGTTTGATTGTTTGSTTGGITTGSTTGTTTGSTTGSTTGTTGSSPFAFYFASDSAGTEKGYRINSDATGKSNVNSGANTVSQIAVSRDLAKIAFVEWGNYKNIWLMNADGSGKVQLTNDDFDNAWPCFSPDGSKILYTSYVDGTPQLWTMNANGTGKAKLTDFPDGALQGKYSPNGQKIVYTTGSLGDDVYIMNANGTGAAALAASATEDENEPCFSADGTKVVFVKAFDNSGEPSGQIMIVNATGGASVRLTSDLQDDREPVVSLDGTTILFTRTFGVGRDVFKMSLSGASPTRITNEAALAVSPSTGN